jgi:hypothetical protein
MVVSARLLIIVTALELVLTGRNARTQVSPRLLSTHPVKVEDLSLQGVACKGANTRLPWILTSYQTCQQKDNDIMM